MFLFMHGKCQPKQWRQDELEVKINTIELLSDVKEKAISKITVSVPLAVLDDQMVMEFSSKVKASPGNAELCFLVHDENGQMHVCLSSRSVKVSVQKDLIDYLKGQPQLEYKIN